MAGEYQSKWTGAEIDDGITKANAALPKTGGVVTGQIDLRGTAASHPLKTRGIAGSDGNGTVNDLYLQYGANARVMLGNAGGYNISADGGSYSGKAARATADANGNNIANTYLTKTGTAAKAIADADGNNIAETYAKKTEIPEGAVVDSALSTTSANPVQNKVVNEALNKRVTLDTAQTITGVKTFNAPTNIANTEQTTVKFKTSNGGSVSFGKEAANSGTMMRLDQADGTCRLRFRGSNTAGAIVWEQPEQGANLYVDLGKDGVDKHRISFPSKAGTLALDAVATTSAKGLMSAADKIKLDDLATKVAALEQALANKQDKIETWGDLKDG